jgi:hypothetical protein
MEHLSARRSPMRKLAGVAISLVILVAFAAVALAGVATSPSGQIQALGVMHSSSQASTKKRPRGVFATVIVQLRKADGTKPSATTESDVHIPQGMKLGYKRSLSRWCRHCPASRTRP